jgi:uncharacterized cupin superfamily protein
MAAVRGFSSINIVEETSSRTKTPTAALDVPTQQTSAYPKPFQGAVEGRIKRKLGNVFGLTNFGVNLTILKPGASSALKHCHSKQDEFIYILKGTATLRLGGEEFQMSAGDCVGFPAGNGMGHCIVNNNNATTDSSNDDSIVEYIEIGDRTPGDEVIYPEVDLQAKDVNGQWEFTNKAGVPYKKE